MPTFTLTLKRALEIQKGDIGLDDYVIFDETYRETLNNKIIDHYYNQEIGMETIELFRLALRRKMNEIMPLYNQHYMISAIEFDPLKTVDMSTLNNVTATGESVSTSGSDAKSRAVAQEMPQTLLSGEGDYATNAQDTVSNTEATGSATESNTTATDGAVTGFQGNAAMMLYQYRQSLVNIDLMIISELQNLFMLVWSNGDEFSERNNYGYDYLTGYTTW